MSSAARRRQGGDNRCMVCAMKDQAATDLCAAPGTSIVPPFPPRVNAVPAIGQEPEVWAIVVLGSAMERLSLALPSDCRDPRIGREGVAAEFQAGPCMRSPTPPGRRKARVRIRPRLYGLRPQSIRLLPGSTPSVAHCLAFAHRGIHEPTGRRLPDGLRRLVPDRQSARHGADLPAPDRGCRRSARAPGWPGRSRSAASC